MKCKYIAATVLALVFFTSCDDFLTHELKDGYNDDTFYKTEEDALRTINGAYNAISFNKSENRVWVFGDVASDDSQKGGGDGDGSEIKLIDEFNVNSTNGVLVEYWQHTYEGVLRANDVIYYVPKIDMNGDLKKRIIAEAKFIRAYSFFKLTNVWGSIPLRLEPINKPQNLHVALSSVDKVYEQIEKDLSEAIPDLLATYTGKDAGRVTKGAAYGLLAKVFLYQNKWDDCLTQIKNLDDLHIYKLEDNYENLFKLGAENNAEVVFAVRHLSNQSPGLGNILNVWFAPSEENGYYFNAPSKSYVDSFDELTTEGKDDPRLDASIGRDGKPWMNNNTFSSSWSPTGYLVKKHLQPFTEVEQGRRSDGGLPYIYLRYADILLMKAEALNQTNKTEDAVKEINNVRGRVKLTDLPLTISQSDMHIAIMKERRHELGFEFHRFFDLMRWGQVVATQALGDKFKWAEPRYYYPIPQTEIDANNAIN